MKIINVGNGKIGVDSPYNPSFVSKIKRAGGIWDTNKKLWVLDERTIEGVRSIMRDVYGMDDTPQQLVDVKVFVDGFISRLTSPIVMFGRVIASAKGRDSGARIGDGVSFEKGAARSSGSVKNWRTEIDGESIFTIYDVPKQAVEQKLNWDDEYGTFEVLQSVNPKATLLKEKETLLERLAEIEKLLKED